MKVPDTTDLKELIWTVVGAVMALLVGLGLLALVTVPIYQSIRSDGRVDYCYTSFMQGTTNESRICPATYVLYGHRPWRSDATIGAYGSQDDAFKAAAAMNCPVAAKQ